MRLLRTPQPHSDESMQGYIQRLSSENCYPDSYSLFKLVGFAKGPDRNVLTHYKRMNPIVNLSELTGISIDVLSQLTIQIDTKSHDKARKVIGIHGQQLLSSMMQNDSTKLCPDCVTDVPYLRWIWSIRAVTACPFHQKLLVEVCPNCGRRISWGSSHIYKCYCGLDYRTITPRRLKERNLVLDRLIYERFGYKINIREKENHVKLPSFVDALSMKDVISLVMLIASQNQSTSLRYGKDFYSKQSNAEINERQSKAIKVITNWPANFYKYLDQVSRLPRSNKREPGISKDFGGFYGHLYTTFNLKQFDFMRVAFEHHIRRHKTKYLGSTRFNAKLLTSDSTISSRSAQRELGVTGLNFNKIRNYLEDNILSGELVTKKAHKYVIVDRGSLAKLKSNIGDVITLKEACRITNLSYYMLKKIRAEGILELKHIPGVIKYKHVPRSSVNAFMDNLKINQCSCPNLNACKSESLLKVYSSLKPHRINIVSIAKDVVAGNFQTCAQSGDEGLFSLKFPENSARKYMNWLLKEKDAYSVDQCAERMKVDPMVIYILIKRGFLTDNNAIGNLKTIPTSELNSFMSQYIKSSELAANMGISCGEVRSLSKQHDVSRLLIGKRNTYYKLSDVFKSGLLKSL